MKLLLYIMCFFPFLSHSNCNEREFYDMRIKAIYTHAKSEKLKYEVYAEKEEKHDIFLIYMGKKEAFTEVMHYITSCSNFYD